MAGTKQYAIIRRKKHLSTLEEKWLHHCGQPSEFRPTSTAQHVTTPQVILFVSPAPETP